jgi:hypothetical protein
MSEVTPMGITSPGPAPLSMIGDTISRYESKGSGMVPVTVTWYCSRISQWQFSSGITFGMLVPFGTCLSDATVV